MPTLWQREVENPLAIAWRETLSGFNESEQASSSRRHNLSFLTLFPLITTPPAVSDANQSLIAWLSV